MMEVVSAIFKCRLGAIYPRRLDTSACALPMRVGSKSSIEGGDVRFNCSWFLDAVVVSEEINSELDGRCGLSMRLIYAEDLPVKSSAVVGLWFRERFCAAVVGSVSPPCTWLTTRDAAALQRSSAARSRLCE